MRISDWSSDVCSSDLGDMTPPPIDPVKNKIVVEPNGTILWNGAPVDPVTLRQYLDITTTMTPTPDLHLQPHPQARYEVVAPVLAITKRATVPAMGVVGHEATPHICPPRTRQRFESGHWGT